MTDRAHSLFRTVLHPVLSSLRLRAGRSALPVTAHHAVPAVQLSGLILNRAEGASAQLAETMYGGVYAFGGVRVEALPDAVFITPPPNPAWRDGLLRMDWLSSFRASGRPVHGLFALRLISAWMKSNPQLPDRGGQISTLFNLAVDAPAIAAQQSPAAIALANAAILRAQQPVAKIRPASAHEALGRAAALLAAHLATRRSDHQRDRLVAELGEALAALLRPDGSLSDGSIDSLCHLHMDLAILAEGLVRAGDGVPAALSAPLARMAGYLALLGRSDGTLAFARDAAMRVPQGLLPPQGSAIAEAAGHARLAGGPTLLHAATGPMGQPEPLRIEMSDGGRPLLWLAQKTQHQAPASASVQLICAAGGTLLEVQGPAAEGPKHHLALFLSGDGSDLRLEDATAAAAGSVYELHVPEQSRLSTTNNGSGAMIVPGAGQAWQLLVRGGSIEVEHGCFRILPDAAESQSLNFALKRMPKVERPARATRPGARGSGSNPRLL